MAQLSQGEEVAYLQDGAFMGFVEAMGAEEIKRSATEKGYKVEDHGVFFNVVYEKGISIDVD